MTFLQRISILGTAIATVFSYGFIFAAILEGLITASPSDTLVKLGLVNFGDDAVLLKTATDSKPISKQLGSSVDILFVDFVLGNTANRRWRASLRGILHRRR